MELPDIPSEFIEPYLTKFIGSRLESLGLGFGTAAELKAELKAIDHFVSMTCGIHARLATSNEVYKIIYMPDEVLTKLCQDVVRAHYDHD